ncbi:uncharacterized protein AC631_05954 [Debaryomyces fabryi]|uniref:Uncharacterized protein n=1 Tax=Debaryomyces fabryi TaxID=58627 RepID=A0A0V1PQL5_9ASCO|nr:uncharacterized protein AC631_05954 [Debaryomyces fabryi]KRZ98286.1 hypothetical protein AC631_05954 [Debaryomyces fabryi]
MNLLSRQIFLWFLVLFNVTSSNPIPRYREGDIIWIGGLNYTLGPDILDIQKRCPTYSYVVSQNATIDNFVNAYVEECPITKHEYNHNYSPVHINKTLYGLIDANTKTVLAVNLDIEHLHSLLNKNENHLLWRDEEEDLLIESTFITPLNLSTVDIYKPHHQLIKRGVANNPSLITELTIEQFSQSDELQKRTNWSDISKYVLSSFFKYVFYYVVGDAVLRFIEIHTESRVISNIVIAYEAIAWLSGAVIGNCARLFVKVFKKTSDLVENYFALLI